MGDRNPRPLDNRGGDAAMNLYFFHAVTLAALSFAIYQLTAVGKAIMSTQDQVDALTTQVAKVQAEVVAAKDVLVAQVVALQDQLANAGVAEQVDLSGLQAAVQALDDINPDPVVEDVAEEPVVEEPVQDAPPF